MSDDHHSDAELDLEAAIVTESDSDSASTTDSTELDLEEKATESTEESKDSTQSQEPKSEAKKKQIVSVQLARVIAGTLELDAIKEPWVRDAVVAHLDKTHQAPDLDSLVDEKVSAKLSKRQDETQFEQLQGELKQIPLTVEQKALLKAKYDKFRTLGMSKGEALAEARDAAHIPTLDEATRQLRRERQKLPPLGDVSNKPPKDYDNLEELSDDEVVAVSQAAMAGTQRMKFKL